MKKILVLLAGFMLSATTAMAATLSVPSQFFSIQQAIDTAAEGDEIVVGNGIYYENLNFPHKKITLRSTGGATQTVIDGGKKAPVMNFISTDFSVFPFVVIDGFTIQNGVGLANNDYGRMQLGAAGGINAFGNWGLTVNNSVLVNNTGSSFGGAISANSYSFTGYASVHVNNSTISNNTAISGGAAWAYMGSSQVWFTKCNILNNHADNGGAFYSGYSSVIRAYDSYVSGNTAVKGGAGYSTGNGGSGIVIQNAVVDLNSATEIGGAFYTDSQTWISGSHNTVTRNTAPTGGSMYISNGRSEITNSIIYGNSSPIYIDTTSLGSYAFAGSIVEGGVAGLPDFNIDPNGVLDADPKFIDPAARNYQLAADSPALDRITNLSLTNDVTGLVRPQGHANDIGAYERFVQDNVAPVSYATVSGTVRNGYYVSDVFINITAQDNASNVKEIHYLVNGVETVVAGAAATISLTSDGVYTVSYFAVDAAGNAEVSPYGVAYAIDKTAPAVTTTAPLSGATGVSTSASTVLTFSENLLQGGSFSGITLKKGSTTVSSTKTISGNKLTIRPSSTMSSATTYTVSVPAGALKDAAGNTNAAYSFSFKTK